MKVPKKYFILGLFCFVTIAIILSGVNDTLAQNVTPSDGGSWARETAERLSNYFKRTYSTIVPSPVKVADTDNIVTEEFDFPNFNIVSREADTGTAKATAQEMVDELYEYVTATYSNVAMAKMRLLEKKYNVKPSQLGRYTYSRYMRTSSYNILNARLSGLDAAGSMSRGLSTELDFLTGARAIDETLQLRSIGWPRVSPEDATKTYPISSLTPVEIESHPWSDMLAELDEPEIPDILKFSPEEDFVVYFEDIEHASNLEDAIKEITATWTNFLDLGEAVEVKKALIRNLGLEDFEKLQSAASEVMFVSENLNFLSGTNYALILKINSKTARKLAEMFAPDKSVNEIVDEYLIVATSDKYLKKLKAAKSGGEPSMSGAKDLEYTLAVLDPRRHGFIYFSETFIRKLTGPAYRLNTARKEAVVRKLLDYQNVVFAYRSIAGKWPASFSTMASGGFLDAKYAAKVDEEYSISSDGWVEHKDWGNLNNLKSVTEVDISTITAVEKQTYERFSQGYQSFFRTFFDPIGIAITAGDNLYFHTIILPLIDESGYNAFKTITGSSPKPFAGLEKPLRLSPVLFMSQLDMDGIYKWIWEETQDARGRAVDASARASMSSMRAQAEIYFDDYRSYGITASSCDKSGSLFTDAGMKRLIERAEKDTGNKASCYSTSKAYAVSLKLKGFTSHWCVDSTGFAGHVENGITSTECVRTPGYRPETVTQDDDMTEEELQDEINKAFNEALELEGDDQVDLFNIFGSEIQFGLGGNIPFELENFADYDVYLAIKLANTKNAKNFINTVYRQYAEEISDEFEFPFMQISTKEPMKNTYGGMDYYVIPSGFLNIYFVYHDDYLYLTISQLSINNLIDSINNNDKPKLTKIQSRSLDYLDKEHNMMLLVDMTPYEQYKTQLVDKFSEGSYATQGMALNMRGYLSDYQLLAATMDDGLTEAQNYYTYIPDKIFGFDLEVGDSDIMIDAATKVSFDKVEFGTGRSRSYYSYRNQINRPIPFSDLFDEKEKERMAEGWDNFKGFSVALSFTEEGLSTKLTVKNPLIDKHTPGFDGSGGLSDGFGLPDLPYLYIGGGLLIVLLLGGGTMIFLSRRKKKVSEVEKMMSAAEAKSRDQATPEGQTMSAEQAQPSASVDPNPNQQGPIVESPTQPTPAGPPPNKELVDFITSSQAAGVSEDEIKDKLINAGWRREEISAAYNHAKPPAPPPGAG